MGASRLAASKTAERARMRPSLQSENMEHLLNQQDRGWPGQRDHPPSKRSRWGVGWIQRWVGGRQMAKRLTETMSIPARGGCSA